MFTAILRTLFTYFEAYQKRLPAHHVQSCIVFVKRLAGLRLVVICILIAFTQMNLLFQLKSSYHHPGQPQHDAPATQAVKLQAGLTHGPANERHNVDHDHRRQP